jgi:hypothetical protein
MLPIFSGSHKFLKLWDPIGYHVECEIRLATMLSVGSDWLPR